MNLGNFSHDLDRFLEIKWVASAFHGIKIAVGILIIDAAVKMILKMKKKPLEVAILSCMALAVMLINIFAVRITTIVLMIAAAVVSLAVYIIGKRKDKEAGK